MPKQSELALQEAAARRAAAEVHVEPYVDNVVLDNFLPSMTQQHMAASCDINRILANFPLVSPEEGMLVYGDASVNNDLFDIMNRNIQLRESFELAPEEIRSRFSSFEEYLEAVHSGQVRFEDPDPGSLVEPSVDEENSSSSSGAPPSS